MSAGWGFEQPAWLWLALLLPAYAFLRWRARLREAVPYAPLQHGVPAAGRRRARAAVLLLAAEVLLLAVMLTAIAGPYRESRYEVMEDAGVDLLLVLDVSLSMLAEDFPPNRLEVLRRLAGDLLARAGGNRVGLVVFARDAYVQTPLTTDRGSLRPLLEGVTVYALDQQRSGGTAVGDALLVAADQLRRVRIEGRDQALVLITDGESNQGVDPIQAARLLRDQGVRLYALGIGSEDAVPVRFEGRPVGGQEAPFLASFDEAQLRRLAQIAGGRFFRALDAGALEEIFDQLSRLERAPLETRTMSRRQPLRGALALVGLLLLAVALGLEGGVLRRPWR